jgi:preprotein translocase subunit YajC
MPTFHALLITAQVLPGHLLLAATAAKKSTSSLASFLPLLILLALGVYLFTRPNRQKMKRQQQMMQTIEVGDRVLTGSGIYGTVLSLEADQAEVEIADGVSITVVRQALARKVEPVAPPNDDDFESRYYAEDGTHPNGSSPAPNGVAASEDDDADYDEGSEDDADYDADYDEGSEDEEDSEETASGYPGVADGTDGAEGDEPDTAAAAADTDSGPQAGNTAAPGETATAGETAAAARSGVASRTGNSDVTPPAGGSAPAEQLASTAGTANGATPDTSAQAPPSVPAKSSGTKRRGSRQ